MSLACLVAKLQLGNAYPRSSASSRLHIVPQDRHFKSAGNFSCSAPNTILLKRGEGSFQGKPALITLEHNEGRVTFTQCEPMWKNDLWLITVVVSWVARGCPTQDG